MRLSDVERHIRQTLGGAPDGVTAAEIANQAGQWMTAIVGWNYLERQSIEVDFTAGQGFIQLPADLITLTSAQRNQSLTRGFELTTLSRLMDLKTKMFPSPNWFYGAVSHKVNTTTGDAGFGKPEPILELWPNPDETTTDALVLQYRAGWMSLTKDGDVVQIRQGAMEPLYLDVVRAFARGYQEEDQGSTTLRLAAIVNGHLLEAARREDATIQPDYGLISGGITSNLSSGWGEHWRDRTINNPPAG